MRKHLVLGGIAFLIVMIETSVLKNIALSGIMPNLSVCLIVSVSMIMGTEYGRSLGLFVGILQDVLFSPYFGFFTLLFYLTGEAAGWLYRRVDSDNLLYTLSIGGAILLVFSFLGYFFTDFMQGRVQIEEYLVHGVLAEMVYSLPFFVVIFLLIRLVHTGLIWLDNKSEEKAMRSRNAYMWRKKTK